MGHCNKINTCIFNKDNTKLLTAGGFEGIYEWDFLGNLAIAEREQDVNQNYKLEYSQKK